MNRNRWSVVAAFVALGFVVIGTVLAEDSQAAKATRKKLQQKISLDLKEVGTKAFFEEVNRELDQAINFKIDNNSGVSNNSKMNFKGKDVTVEKMLNELCDKYDFGYVVISNVANNKVDGSVVLRKSSKGKERGYDAEKK